MNYNLNTFVSNSEAEALKEMIFKRARERAEAMNKDINTNYTDSVQNDVMEIARNSFTSAKNPFSLAIPKTEEVKQSAPVNNDEAIGFSPRKVDINKSRVEQHNKISTQNIQNQALEENMNNARNEFSKTSGFMGALEFLNSQASISLIKVRAKNFEAIA